MENMRQCFHAWPHPVRGRSLLTGGDIGMLPPHFSPALATGPGVYGIEPNFRLRLRRNVGSRHEFPVRFPQGSPTIGTALQRDQHLHRFHFRLLIRYAPEPKEPLSRLSPRWLRICFARAFRKRCRPASALQLLNFGPKLLDHSILIEYDLHQFFAAE